MGSFSFFLFLWFFFFFVFFLVLLLKVVSFFFFFVEEKKRERKKKKKVQFAENVKEPSGNGEEYRKVHMNLSKVERCCRNEISTIRGMPENRIALYNGILKDRVQRMQCSFWWVVYNSWFSFSAATEKSFSCCGCKYLVLTLYPTHSFFFFFLMRNIGQILFLISMYIKFYLFNFRWLNLFF